MGIGYMFSGQGAQYAGMGLRTAQSSAEAARVFSRADSVLGYSISETCFRGSLEDLTPCAVCQPAIFTVSMAFLAAYGAGHPEASCSACGGLSLGEFSAACSAGVFGFDDALRLVAERGRLMDKCCRQNPGGMAAVIGGAIEDIADACAESGIDIANYNCPGQTVISGCEAGLARACSILEGKVLKVVRLTVAGAYHSRLMEPAAEAFGKVLEGVGIATPACMFAQNAVGGFVSRPDEIRDNLRRQVSSSVRWEQCLRQIMGESESLLEFGPGNVLTGFVRRVDKRFKASPAIVEESAG